MPALAASPGEGPHRGAGRSGRVPMAPRHGRDWQQSCWVPGRAGDTAGAVRCSARAAHACRCRPQVCHWLGICFWGPSAGRSNGGVSLVSESTGALQLRAEYPGRTAACGRRWWVSPHCRWGGADPLVHPRLVPCRPQGRQPLHWAPVFLPVGAGPLLVCAVVLSGRWGWACMRVGLLTALPPASSTPRLCSPPTHTTPSARSLRLPPPRPQLCRVQWRSGASLSRK